MPAPRELGNTACACHEIEWQLSGRGRAEVRGRGRTRRHLIRTPAVRGQLSHFIALHEIGHLAGPGHSGTRLEKGGRLASALSNSIVAPTEATWIGALLRSYVAWAELRQHRSRPPVLPPSASAFWTLLGYLDA